MNGYRSYEVELDFTNLSQVNTAVNFKQYDYGTSTIIAKLVNNGIPLNITDNEVVVTVFKTSQGIVIKDDNKRTVKSYAVVRSIEEGIVEVPIPKQVLKTKGSIISELVVLSIDGSERRTSPAFTFTITESLIDFDELLEQ